MKKSLLCGFITAVCLLQTACFEWLDASRKVASTADSTSLISNTQFRGAISASNKVTGILISWSAVTDLSLVKAYNIYRISGTKKTLLSSLAPSLTSYMDGTVVWGTIYTYQVKAVDNNGIEDNNTATVKSLSWAGISAVTASSRTALTISITNTATAVDEVRIYGQLGIGGNKTLLATVGGSDTEVTVSGLRIGYQYIISAQAYISSLGKEDGNDVSFTTTTLTVGYDDDNSDIAQWRNVIQVRAFGDAPGAPVQPNVPEKSPQSKIVELVFNAFSSAGSTAKYVVTRVADGNTMDSSVSTACTNTTTTSCRVCDNLTSSNDAVVCRDSSVEGPPAKYRYSISLVQTDASSGDTWVEPLPSDENSLESFSVLVPIPPNNMVLVQRDAANYENCTQLRKSMEPKNHNRCLYAGVGGVPYSSGHNKAALNLPTGYYDFGYNLFVDRWPMACNWTTAEQGGKCGANHSSGDCIDFNTYVSTQSPQTTQGDIGNVYFHIGNGSTECFVATARDSTNGTTWIRMPAVTSRTDASSIFANTFTNDPGYKLTDSSGNVTYSTARLGRRGRATNNISPNIANMICSSQTDNNYGIKRMPRLREIASYVAIPILTTELYSVGSYTVFDTYYHLGNQSRASYYGCDSSSTFADGLPSTLSQIVDDTTLSPGDSSYFSKNLYRQMTMLKDSSYTYGNRQFMIGAQATVDCQSRYGVQEINYRTFANDTLYFDLTKLTTTGMSSIYDNGNRDLLADLYGTQTGFPLDNSKLSSGSLQSNSTNFTAFVVPLGLPITASSYTDYIPRAQFSFAISSAYWTWLGDTSSNTSGPRTIITNGRWGMRSTMTLNDTSSAMGDVRCVLPAE